MTSPNAPSSRASRRSSTSVSVVVSRKDPVTVPPGTSLAGCVAAIQRTGTGDSVFVTHPDGRLAGVLTERDIFGRIVGGDVDLSQPVETMMTTKPHHLHVEETVRDAIELMQTGRYRNVPLLDDEDHLIGRRPAAGHPQVPRRGVPGGAPQPSPATAPADAQGRGRITTAMTTETRAQDPELQELDRVTIRFAGDSGDGMQLTGTQFTRTAAVYGNDISTLPDFPAEIRAPAGSPARRLGLPDQLQLERHPHARATSPTCSSR